VFGNVVIESLDTFQFDYSQAVNETELSIDIDPMCQIKTRTMKTRIATANGQVKSITNN